MVIQGHDSTLPVTMDQLVYHLECVVNGNQGAHIMADMPFMSYATDDMGLENAKRLMQAGANSIKIEGGEVRSISFDAVIKHKRHLIKNASRDACKVPSEGLPSIGSSGQCVEFNHL